MITLDDHHGGKPCSPVCESHTRSETATAVSDAIANLERALVAAGNAPGTFGLILGNGAIYINEPVVMKAAQDLVNRGKVAGLDLRPFVKRDCVVHEVAPPSDDGA